VGTVRRHRQVEGFGEVGDLHESRHTAAIGDVGLGVADAACGDHVLELPERSHVLAGGDRQPALAQHPDVPSHVVGDQRFLQPVRFVGLEGAGRSNRLVRRPLHVGVDHQGEAVSQVRAHRRELGHVFRQPGTSDLHLDRAESLLEIAVSLRNEFGSGEFEIDAAGIAGHGGVVSPE
jgi:hypothetical protein